MKLGRVLIVGSAGVLVIYAASKAGNLAAAAENLDYVITRSSFGKENKIEQWIASPMSAQLHYEITLKIKNPSDQEIRFTYPYLKILYNGTIIGTSDLENSVGVAPLKARGSVEVPFKVAIDSAPLLSEVSGFKTHIIKKISGQYTAPIKLTILVFTEANGITVPPVPITWEV